MRKDTQTKIVWSLVGAVALLVVECVPVIGDLVCKAPIGIRSMIGGK